MNTAITIRKPSTSRTICNLKNAGQDFEWYPTTQKMIDTIKADITGNGFFFDERFSLLDCGAGDGRILKELGAVEKFAIEKSEILREMLDKDICVIGTDFNEQTLIDKKVDVLFSNPPYLEFVEWVKKIIREANTALIYLIVPTRWKENAEIQALLKLRQAEATVISTQDFNDADRQARAVVDIIRIEMGYCRRGNSHINVDPFDLWFEQNFNIKCQPTESSKHFQKNEQAKSFDEKLKTELVSGQDIICILENLYNHDLDELLRNYKAIEQIDPALLYELGVNLKSVKEGVKQKIEGLKDLYWKKLLENLRKITDRLCSKTRQKMLDKFMRHIHVDFTASNAYAVVIWVLKSANEYFDSQLIDVVRELTNQESVINYKSNQRTLQKEQWRYLRHDAHFESLGAYKLDYRFITNSFRAITETYDRVNLCENAVNRINDILTIANNLGFDITNTPNARERQWESNKAQYFYYTDSDGQQIELAKIRAFKNGNIHYSLNQKFLCRLNVEFGRLMGWVKSAREAAEEMDISVTDAMESFNCNLRIGVSDILKLENNPVTQEDRELNVQHRHTDEAA